MDNSPATAPNPSRRYARALLWGNGGMLAGIAVAVFVVDMSPYPIFGGLGLHPFDELLYLVVGLGVAGGAAALWGGLQHASAAQPLATALAFVPAAVMLGWATTGLGVLVAPPLAHWLVAGFTREARLDRSGILQRVLVAAGLSAFVTWRTLRLVGRAWGGGPDAEFVVWAFCLPVLIVVPLLLLVRRLPVVVLAGGIALSAGLTALAVPGSIDDAVPSPARLERVALELPVPAGLRVDQRVGWLATGNASDRPSPIQVLLGVPEGPGPSGTANGIPAALRGPTPPNPRSRPLPATRRGQTAADEWERLLLADGWDVAETSGPEGGVLLPSTWLPSPVQVIVDVPRRFRYERGPRLRASVVPYGDGALVVLSALS